MDPNFWIEAWEAGRTGFHLQHVHADLRDLGARWLGDAPRRVLVPLCGQSVDLLWLRDQGHEVVGIELSEAAVRGFFDRHGLTAEVAPLGPLTAWRTPGLTVLQGDLFQASPALLEAFDRIWDRAALVALAPAQRAPYVDTLRALCQPGAQILLNTFAYDQTRRAGPPHSVPAELVRSLYAEDDVQLWREEDASHRMPVTAPGLDRWLVQTLFITVRGAVQPASTGS